MSDTYLRRNECGHLVRVHRTPPPDAYVAVEAILRAYADAFRRPPPDDWRGALAAIVDAATPERVAPLGEPTGTAWPDEQWEMWE